MSYIVYMGIVKLGSTGVYIIFLILALKRRLWVLVRTASKRLSSFSVACFWCQSFGGVSPYVFILFLVRFVLLSDHLLGNSCSLS